MTGNWWALALRAAAAILLGIVALVSPIVTLATLVTLFGVYAIADGVLAIVAAVRGVRNHDHWGWMFVEGIIGVAAGAVAIVDPAIGALAFTWLVAAWALVTGAFEIAAAVKLRRIMSGEWLLALAGVLSVILGIVVAALPGLGAVLLVTWIGAYAIVYGVVTLALAWRIRQWTHANV
jgi:uncharacterized membrane protein HdeD (DUF308 family)